MTLQLNAALKYASLGWKIFPVREDTKLPATPNGHLDATCDLAQIQAWWTAYPDARIGLFLRASGLIAIDVDIADGKPGAATIAALEAEHGPLPRTLHQRSGRGGEHIVLADPSPGPEGWTRLRDEGGMLRGKLGPKGGGVDIKCNGYILLEPSGSYRWLALTLPAPPVPEGWVSALRYPENAATGSTKILVSNGWDDPIGAPLGQVESSALRSELAALGPRGCGTDTTIRAVSLIHHGYGLSVSEGRPFLEWWNGQSGKTLSPGDLDRQVARIAIKDDHRGERGAIRRGAALARRWQELRTGRRPEPLLDDLPDASDPGVVDPVVAMLLEDVARIEKPPVRSYPTGDTDLDRMIGGGLCTRQLLIVCAPPADGKSALAVQWSLHHAEHHGPVLYVSTELESDEIAARHAANVLDLPWTRIVRGQEPRERVVGALEGRRIRAVGCEVLPREGALEMIAREAMALCVDGETPLVIVDYLQDLARGVDEKSVRGKMGDIATTLRAIAQRLDCPIVAVGSVSRTYYGSAKQQAFRDSEDPRVYLACAKESGDIDYAAATVLFLDVDVRKDEEPWRSARIAVAKARHGDPSYAGARFYGASGRWVPCAQSLIELSPEETAKRHETRKADRAEKRVVEFLEREPLATKADVKACGGNSGDNLAALDRMLASGKIIPRGTVRRGNQSPEAYALASSVPIGAPPPVSLPEPPPQLYRRS